MAQTPIGPAASHQAAIVPDSIAPGCGGQGQKRAGRVSGGGSRRTPALSPFELPYSSYQGAYGQDGRAAERAYLVRTAFWTSAYRLFSSGRRLPANL